jgi:Helicase HerA, central domain
VKPHLISRWFESQNDKEDRETLELCARVEWLLAELTAGDPNWIQTLLDEVLPTPFEEIEKEHILENLERIVTAEGTYCLQEKPELSHLRESQAITIREKLRGKERALSFGQPAFLLFQDFLKSLVHGLYHGIPISDFSCLKVPICNLHSDFAGYLDDLVSSLLSDELFDFKLFQAEFSRLRPLVLVKDKVVLPSESKHENYRDLIDSYFENSAFFGLLSNEVYYQIPSAARQEHTQILGGSGHGKTELMKILIEDDLIDSVRNGRSVLVMDSQGDLLDTLLRLPFFHPENGSLKDQLIVIDPNDLEMPPALNLFALGIDAADALTKEKKIQSAVALYEYLFGELLGAELTQRQGTLFSYLARLMLEIPGATIHTLRDVLEHGERYKGAISKLSGSARDFFDTKFLDPSFKPVKSQIVNRLWGILSSGTLDRMFSHKEMLIDLGSAFQSGKIILVNTAKELLKKEGSSFFGRFILSLVSHSIVERAGIRQRDRLPVSIYVDEAHEYLDTVMMELFNQSRKFGVSLTVAHQNLDQLSADVRSSIAASTSVKFAGGVSDKDARSMAGDMHTSASFILSKRKGHGKTEFALSMRNVITGCATCTVPLGEVDRAATLSDQDVKILLKRNSEKYGRSVPVRAAPVELHMPTIPLEKEKPKPKLATPIPKAAPVQGKGSQEHKYLQALVKRLGEAANYRAEIEKAVDGGFVDVLLRRGQEIIAVEIQIGTDINYELGNVRKCLSLNPNSVLLISSDKRHLEAVKRSVTSEIEPSSLAKIHFLLPSEIAELIVPLPEMPSPEAEFKMVNGYKVRVTKSGGSSLDMESRRKRVAEVIARSLGKG